MKKQFVIVGVGAVIFLALIAILTLLPKNSIEQSSNTPAQTSNESGEEANQTQKAAGRYVEYQPSLLSEKGYTQHIIFFHAAWCPECRAFEQAIESEAIPEGVQILKLDYDTSTEYRQRYAVTLQSTFVSVNSQGNKVSSWVGYGKDKSVATIIENL